MREISIQFSLNQPLPQKNILQLYGHFTDEKNLYVVLELATGGELMSHIHGTDMTESTAAHYIWQLVQALLHCHKYHVIHRRAAGIAGMYLEYSMLLLKGKRTAHKV